MFRSSRAVTAVALALAMVTSVLASPSGAQQRARQQVTVVAHLTGSGVVPAVVTRAQGQAVLRYERGGDELEVRLSVSVIENVVGAHLHVRSGSPTGPVVVELIAPRPAGSGWVSGGLAAVRVTADDLVGPLAGLGVDALVEAIEQGDVYVDVHTDDGLEPSSTGPGDYPGGELRGDVGEPAASEPFTFEVDPSLAPPLEALPDEGKGPRPLVASRDESGVVSVFVADEVVLRPRSDVELQAFLRRFGGTIVEDNEVPVPPPGLGIDLTDAERAATEYAVRIDTSRVSLVRFANDAEAIGLSGARTLSSGDAARVIAAVADQRRRGVIASPNYLNEPAQNPSLFPSMLYETEELSGDSESLNAFEHFGFRFRNDMNGSFSNVLRAWQFVAAEGIERRPSVAIIDAGFWIDGTGRPGTIDPTGISDFSDGDPVVQYDFDGEDYLAGGPNPVICPDTACLWHGNDAASVAFGIPDNGYGAAGTGGWVADPMLFRTNLLRFQIAWALRTAASWNADVASISTAGPCGFDCSIMSTGAFDSVVDAQRDGVVIVAAAGNTADDLGPLSVWPCSTHPVDGTPGPICVGSLDNGTTNRAGFSSYGSVVDLFAPTNVFVTPTPATKDAAFPVGTMGGTSASTPFVAGVAAMMLAIEPDLTPGQVDAILRDTAWTDSADATVPRYVNAYAAVRAANGGVLRPDILEPNDSPGNARPIALANRIENLTSGPDSDYYSFTVDEHSDVSIDLTYMKDLGVVDPILLDTGTTAPPIGAPIETQHPDGTDEGKTVTYAGLSPGAYTLGITGTDPALYDLVVDANPAPLEPDAFEINDTVATAAVPDVGQHLATLHDAADIDHYRHTLSIALDPNLKTLQFRVTYADQPVALRVYRDGALVGSRPPSLTPWVEVVDAGSYVFEVDAPSTVRYTFRLGTQASEVLTGPNFPVPIEQFWFIDPTDAVNRWLLAPLDGFVLVQNTYQLETFEGLRLEGDGLHATLYDLSGDVIAQGIPTDDPATSTAETLSFANTTEDQTYILVVDRTEARGAAVLPLLSYELGWQEVP